MNRLLTVLLLTSALLPRAAEATDLNCNGIEWNNEDSVDLGDPVCEATVDDLGEPWPNQDYYFWYEDFGCLYSVVDNDLDHPGWPP